MQAYVHFMDKVNQILKYIVSLVFIILSILVVLQVITRFIVDYPLSWSEEISRYLMVYIVFFGSALAIRTHQHIAIDFLPEMLSGKNKRKLTIITLWICIVFFALLSYYGSILTITVIGQATPTLQFSMSFAYAAIPIGSTLMLLNALAVLVEMRLTRTNHQGGAAQ
ncbi:TRAP transporter small permease [Lentibacillus sp. N15]|uniref:TRAP transporter small permease n=1 Tax=Lentibacillus songyuanensis TaxID=3136161 RepID=UPI0031BBBB3F